MITRRVVEIAATHNLDVIIVRRLLDETCAAFRMLPATPFGADQVIDYTSEWLGVGWSLELLIVQTALDVIGAAALLRHADQEGSGDKVTLSGHVTPEMVSYFMNIFALQQGLTGVYGVPERGYAGGYL